jgi:hypothetical protein
MSDHCTYCPVKYGPCVGERTKRLCELIDPGHSAFDARYKQVVIDQSNRINGVVPTSMPPIHVQAKNLFRSARGWVKSGLKLAPKDVRKARLAICLACPKYDPSQGRCTVCTCFAKAKVFIASDCCPLPEPKWKTYEAPK